MSDASPVNATGGQSSFLRSSSLSEASTAAIVGDPDQILEKLHRYQALGIDSFILSGYPHADECDLFTEHVLPRLRTYPTQTENSETILQ
jgi:alkanesulfonate monooxygenase SsuD/methylene tetrahydromethanopterin reductase-like flavin-dependent oxidoreductase (luciferase family)